ncbi:ABC transporter ATP-binding protein [Ralstonia syzygii]|uniref:Branched-chain amino acid ABC transporter,ATP-binding protein (LivF like) n=1 Tax=Ralstonia syzygii R24 TaxID=907261 RepID=G3A7I3_9RALS|nr:ABC transporter ATP-binding protein [Ralstonia syzygii]CCA86456.1 Branched-chain amino acid ABC transporter,ATP-binding protein (livF like) [Ralstonia syzygii R24]
MLEIKGLSVRYGAITAVHECNLVAATGTMTAILGANGAGKSSLMKAISGLARGVRGQVLLDGQDVTTLPAHARAKLGIVHAMEGRRLFHRMTVEENLRLAWDFRCSDTSFATALERTYTRFPILKEKRSTQAGLMSGGQQQMLILSSALIHQPRCLLLDEPSLGLAPVIVQQIFSVINEVRQAGTTILLCEQVAALALRFAEYGYVLRRGCVVRHGRAADLAADSSLSAAYLGS